MARAEPANVCHVGLRALHRSLSGRECRPRFMLGTLWSVVWAFDGERLVLAHAGSSA